MDPISFSIELELGSLLIAAVGALATWLHNRRQKELKRQRERHHQEHMNLLRTHERNIETLADREPWPVEPVASP